jgi:hypothetical protein
MSASARIRAMQAFLVECRMRHLMGGLPEGVSVSPALDRLPAESWELVLQDWVEWARAHAVEVDEAIERALGFWDSVRTDLPWKASFLMGYDAVTVQGSGRYLKTS